MNVSLHNRVLRAATRRAEELEPRLAALLVPILEKAGDEAAQAFTRLATDHISASAAREAVTAAAPASTSTMIALYPRPSEAEALAQPGGEEPGILHVTLCYVGDTDEEMIAELLDAMRPVAARFGPLIGVAGGIGSFGAESHSDGSFRGPSIVLPDVPGLVELRVAVSEALLAAGLDYSREHGFCPHITLSYAEGGLAAPPEEVIGLPLHFDELVVARGDVPHPIPLTGAPALTAAAGDPPPWTAPFGDELLDVDRLVATLRTKTDPVRLAVIETMTKHSLEGVGLEFDVNNPFVSKALASTGANIANIAETTRENVMGVIRASYEQGLTIPDTAAAIRAGMRAAAGDRAVVIARTELVGAVNGGSLAATQIVQEVTGVEYRKQWMTAPGAQFPRHEDYDGLDGQEVALDEPFDVGGSSLMYPGDPDGPPEEVIQCRCTMAYVEGEGGAVAEGAVPDEEASAE